MWSLLDIRTGKLDRLSYLALMVAYTFLTLPIMLVTAIPFIPFFGDAEYDTARMACFIAIGIVTTYIGLLIEVRRLRDIGSHPFPAVIGVLLRVYLYSFEFLFESAASADEPTSGQKAFLAFLLSLNPLNNYSWILILGYYLILVFMRGSPATTEDGPSILSVISEQSDCETQEFKGRG